MKNIHDCILCYTDMKTGKTGWVPVDDRETENWRKNNSTLKENMLFMKNKDILAIQNNLQENFTYLCSDYGLEPDAIEKTYTSKAGHMVKIKGIAVHNRKYPIIITDMTNGKNYRVSPAWMRSIIIKT